MTGSRRLLELLETERFRAVFERFKRDRYPAKHFISRPDSRRDRVFILIEGQARVFLGVGDKEFTLTFLAPGDIYSTHTRAFVQTTRESLFLSVDTALVGRTLLQYPEVTAAMIGVSNGQRWRGSAPGASPTVDSRPARTRGSPRGLIASVAELSARRQITAAAVATIG